DDPAARRLKLIEAATAAGVDNAGGLIDQHFTFHALADMAEGLATSSEAEGVVIDPFDPLVGWNRGERTEFEHLDDATDRIWRFAVAHQVHCWLLAPPVAVRDLQPSEEVRKAVEQDAATGGVKLGESRAPEGEFAEPLPYPPMWAIQFADAVVIHRGKAYRYRLSVLSPLEEAFGFVPNSGEGDDLV